MAYIPIFPDADKALTDLVNRKEFRAFNDDNMTNQIIPTGGFIPNDLGLPMFGFRLSGAQTFIRNLMNPDTTFSRILIKWQTGTGKSIAAICIAMEFMRQFRRRAILGENPPTIYVLSFSFRETIQEDLLKYPEFGFVSQSEIDELKKLRSFARETSDQTIIHKLSTYLGILRKRFSDRSRGGFFKFYGYKEFANQLLRTTKKGDDLGMDLRHLCGRDETEVFGERLTAAVRDGYFEVNEDLIRDLKHGLIIADEIHNVYNMIEKNNYGLAIQYALDVLGSEAPRAVYMSATPITGSASVAIDILNLLIPKDELPNQVCLRRTDFFTKSAIPGDKSSAIISQMKDGAIDRMSELFAGRVSFLLDSDVNLYPKRIFLGEEVPSVPYLLITKCPMSQFHLSTLQSERDVRNQSDNTRGLTPESYALYDIAFPNPDSTEVGLYKSSETFAKLHKSSSSWKEDNGVITERTTDQMPSIITGNFLSVNNLSKYSTKFSKMISDILSIVRGGPGKILVYHHRVRMSGVILIQEILRMNGFADEYSPSTENTMCGICGIIRKDHSDSNGHTELGGHTYVPARFVVVHSSVDSLTMAKSMDKYNSVDNLEGNQYRVLIGSKIIREGHNFTGVRHQLICSLPTDYPTMIQVIGRVVRKFSHIRLPPKDRTASIRVYVSTFPNQEISPELQRYIDKGKEFLVIQEIERVIHKRAVDGFTNYGRVQKVLSSKISTLDGLPYSPIVRTNEGDDRYVNDSTFIAYGYGDKEVCAIAAMCKILFASRPVWTYDDLWKAIKSGVAKGISYDVNFLDEDNFALALQRMSKYVPPVLYADPYYILAKSIPNPLDIESYIRDNPYVLHGQICPIKTYEVKPFIESTREEYNFNVYVSQYEATYFDGNKSVEMSLVECGHMFHYALLRAVISKKISMDPKRINIITTLYSRFKLIISDSDAKSSRVYKGNDSMIDSDWVGYVSVDSVVLYDGTGWYDAPLSDFRIGRRFGENDIIIGFVNEGNNTYQSKFKVRPPSHKLIMNKKDTRTIVRGAVCETRSRSELSSIVSSLKAEITKYRPHIFGTMGGSVPDALSVPSIDRYEYVALQGRKINKRFPSAVEMCMAIKTFLLALEEISRSAGNGMETGIRWIYLYSDRTPTLSAI